MYDTYVMKQVGYFLDEHMEIRKQTGKTDAYVLEIVRLREQDELIEDLVILELIGRVSGGKKGYRSEPCKRSEEAVSGSCGKPDHASAWWNGISELWIPVF